MNKQVLTVAFLLLNIAFSSAAFLQGPKQINILAQIKKIDQTTFGQKLMDTIALQLGAKAPLSDVSKLLNDILSDLESQQNDAQALMDSRNAECTQVIAQYHADIDSYQANVIDSTSQIQSYNDKIANNKAKIENFEKQLDIVNSRRDSLENSHNEDVASFNIRQEEHSTVIDALDVIIPKLQSIQAAPEKPENVFIDLARIGKSNPIAALVTLATSLDMDALNNVIGKLSEIRDSINQSMIDDQAA